MLFFRKDLLGQAGVQPPKTWDEVVQVADAVQKKSGTAGLAMYYGKGNGAQNLFLWLNHLWGRGGDIFADNFRATRFNEPVAVEATQAYLDYLLKHKVAAPGSVQFVEADAVNSVAQGNSAMVMVWWWVYPQLAGGPQSTLKLEQVGFAPMPQFSGGKPVSYALSLPFAISASSGQKEAAFEFLKWVSSPELEVACATDKSDKDTADIVVTHKASFNNEKVNEANFGLHRVAGQSLEGSRIMPQLKEWPQIASVLENTISELATGSKPVRAGLDGAAQEVDRLLRRAGYRR
jgi:multiple sugar transport system substrate-binding protein